eukprot:gene8539-biopygen105
MVSIPFQTLFSAPHQALRGCGAVLPLGLSGWGSHFSQFVTGGSKIPGNSGLRAAIRTAARARAPGAQMIRMASSNGCPGPPLSSLLASGWLTGGLNVEHAQERDREQVSQVRCWGDPGGDCGRLPPVSANRTPRMNLRAARDRRWNKCV